MIENRQFRLSRFDVIGAGSIAEVVERWVGRDALRWYIAQITDEEIVVEATYYEGEIFESSEGIEGRRRFPGRSVVLSIVPTGVGCSLGGYAGDGKPKTITTSCSPVFATACQTPAGMCTAWPAANGNGPSSSCSSPVPETT